MNTVNMKPKIPLEKMISLWNYQPMSGGDAPIIKSRWTNQQLDWICHGVGAEADHDNKGMIVRCVSCGWLGYEQAAYDDRAPHDYWCPHCKGEVLYLLLSEAQKRLLSPELP